MTDALRGYLRDLLEFWRVHGVDREHGGFISRVDAHGRPDHAPRRLLVQARQIYAFSVGARLGLSDAGLDQAERGYAWMVEHAWDDAHGGWFHTLTAEGEPLDTTKDLYDHAFAIFALEHLARTSGSQEPRARAHETYAVLCDRLADPGFGGFFESADRDWTPHVTVRRQNPHMHLVEALLALGEHTEADRLIALCDERFVTADGSVCEFFDAQWRPHPERAGVVEPGHGYEWVWLLHARGGERASALADRLWAFAERHGVDRDGLVFDGLAPDGTPALRSKRLWPQTERWKACAARRLPADVEPVVVAYRDPERGGWHEQIDAAGQRSSTLMNATSVYHVAFAISELLAVAGEGPRG